MAAQGSGNINSYFDIVYAQKALYSKAELLPGNSLAISSGGVESGCYGFYDFDALLEPPFVTVPSSGSIAMAQVQEWPCGVTNDCLLLLPKPGVPHAMLYVAAAAVRSEGWRFSYGRRATPARIASFPLPHSPELIERVNSYLERAAKIEDQLLAEAEDALDSRIARECIDEIAKGQLRVVSGTELETRLAAIPDG